MFVLFIPVWWHRSQDLVVHCDTKLRKRILRLLVPIGVVVGRLTWVSNRGIISPYNVSLTEEGKVCINHEIYHLIGCTNVETIAEPIKCHLCGCHSVKHEVLQVLQGLRRGEKCFVHTGMMAHPADFGSSWWYRTAEENLKVACANHAGGRAAAQFVLLTAQPLSNSNYLRDQHTHPGALCNSDQ